MDNKTILEKANEAVSKGDNRGFLDYCTDDVKWVFVGDITLEGKEKIHAYMQETYKEPPIFDIDHMMAEGDYVTAVGKISLFTDEVWIDYDYCDIWKFRDGKMAELKAFVI